MAINRLLRITPGRTLTLNNRWFEPVMPKKTIFFIPPELDQGLLWGDMLKTTHKKSFLFIHIVDVMNTGYSERIYAGWENQDLIEIKVHIRNFITVRNVKTIRFGNINSLRSALNFNRRLIRDRRRRHA